MKTRFLAGGALLATAAVTAVIPAAGANAAVSPAAVAMTATCPSAPAPPQLTFGPRVVIDTVRPGGEPVSNVAQDGSIEVSTHGGTTHLNDDWVDLATNPTELLGWASTYSNQVLNWRSTDGGKTWAYTGFDGTTFGPHTATSTGFSDPDYSMDAGGRIYNTEIDLGNVSVFSSGDDGQTYSRGVAEVTSGDRPWLTAGRKDEVYLDVYTEKQILRSADGGLTWSLQSLDDGNSPESKMLIDPLNPDTLIGAHDRQGITISTDQGKTWTVYDGAGLGSTVENWGPIGVDKAGNIYRAAAGGYNSSSNGTVTFNWFDRTAKSWGTPVTIPAPAGKMLWPWMTAGDDGRVAVAWLEQLPGSNSFDVYVAATTNAHGTPVTCSDGSQQIAPPQWTVTDASNGPIQVGPICLSGTMCEVNGVLGRQDRRLGDFFTLNYDKNGSLFVATASTVDGGATRPTSAPIFFSATGGPSMLTQPMTTRPTRPSCGVNPLC